MTTEQIPLMQQKISMLTDKIDEVSNEVKNNFAEFKEESKRQQTHREETLETLKFHAEQREADAKFREELLEKLEAKFAGKWTEKIIIFIGWIMWTAIVGAIMTLILRK